MVMYDGRLYDPDCSHAHMNSFRQCLMCGGYPPPKFKRRMDHRWGHEWASVAWMATASDRFGFTPDFIRKVIASHGMSPEDELSAWKEWADEAIGTQA